jgi:ATP-dependent RNA helicase RhlE
VHRIGRTGRAGASGLAITLVTRDDTRLVSDIEKLIKKKLEIEPFEFEDERPRMPPRRREEREVSSDREPLRDAAPREPRERAPRAWSAGVPAAPPADPFFDRPYEASGGEAAAAWEAAPKPAMPARGLSPNIRPKKKVASLLGGGQG